ncbi:translation initiation factor IF3-1, mitochondrial isoform X2 [Arabidopsis lyrata subsp. lyrata]|uniref:translation initiation factor IF3-1, mitochondrial isoform X2 n=1 Tax=Arabidopsis lyrata subsp. lyrata TaxID=81972 RepID=UPI000A29E2B9|nr:translation initiation factor IF3-1, mitochondrial isoform X2 [Arabidopsis lyrata subsp. lyrata]|eukprot:XP_020868642.1 translation initiation factor IF3-1, mitochondrial isoform X2 [Arabidopsis lyrata subsp. lyrata]
MAIWRIINRSCLKYASNQLTRNYYTQVCLASTHVVKQTTKLSSFDIPNSYICTRPSNIFLNLRFLATSAQTRKKDAEVDSDGPRLNEKITGDYVRLVSEEGHCVVSLREALRRAKELECDLVEVQRDAKPPVCKIVKYSLEQYKKAKVGKERAKAKRAEAIRPEVKEIRFTPKIEAKDLKFKSDQALKLMESGYRVKCNAVPDKDKHKELEPEKLLELLFRFTCYIGDALVEFGPEADRKSAVVIVRHAKFGPPKKGGVKKLKDIDIKSARVKEESPKSDSSEAGESTVDYQGDIEQSEPEFSVEQAQPVQAQNTYAKREPGSEFSGGRDASRFEPRSPNQHVNPQRPRFQAPNQQPTGRFDPQSPNQPPSAPRPQFPNQQPAGRFDPQFPNQPPGPPRRQFPDQAPNQQPSGPSPNRHIDRQGPPPRFQNQAPNQQPTGRFEPQPPNPPRAPPRPQTRLPNKTPNQQPTAPGRSGGPASGYGIFSTPKTK